MNGATEDRMLKQLDRLERKIDHVAETLTAHRLDNERRLTRVETRSTIFGTIGGGLGGFLSGWLR